MRERAKLVIVTGASGGIGRAISESLEIEGYHVIGVDVPNLEPGVAPSYWIKFDLRRLSTITGLLDFELELADVVGDSYIDALINNAAIQHLGSVDDLTPELVADSLAVNCVAAFSLTKILLSRLRTAEQPKPWVINITSIHSRLTKPGFCAYAASKAALEGLTRATAVEQGERVNVCCISPAAIATDMLRSGFGGNAANLKSLASLHPTKEIGQPQEIASLVHFLISGRLPFANGGIWNLDGGISSRLHDPI